MRLILRANKVAEKSALFERNAAPEEAAYLVLNARGVKGCSGTFRKILQIFSRTTNALALARRYVLLSCALHTSPAALFQAFVKAS
jgi:hypothetical protein